jgi:hypothetical protein
MRSKQKYSTEKHFQRKTRVCKIFQKGKFYTAQNSTVLQPGYNKKNLIAKQIFKEKHLSTHLYYTLDLLKEDDEHK